MNTEHRNDLLKSKGMHSHGRSASLFSGDLVGTALRQSFVKLNPKIMFRNPVMFTVEVGTLIMLLVSIYSASGAKDQGTFSYNFIVFIILLLTLLFANFAEAIAEARARPRLTACVKPGKRPPLRK